MKPITREELDRWKQLADAATAGPWEADTRPVKLIHGTVYLPIGPMSLDLEGARVDAEFIAAARDAVPRLVAEVERLTEEYGRAAEVVVKCSGELGLLTGENMQLTEEVERLREKIGYCDHEWRLSCRQTAADGRVIHQVDKCDKCGEQKEYREPLKLEHTQ
jgi:hypothetical protein